jgi:MOB kinase activator 1
MVKHSKYEKEGQKAYQLKKYAEATLGSGNLRLAVVLPDGEDVNEWLAVHSMPLLYFFDFYILLFSFFLSSI